MLGKHTKLCATVNASPLPQCDNDNFGCNRLTANFLSVHKHSPHGGHFWWEYGRNKVRKWEHDSVWKVRKFIALHFLSKSSASHMEELGRGRENEREKERERRGDKWRSFLSFPFDFKEEKWGIHTYVALLILGAPLCPLLILMISPSPPLELYLHTNN